MLVLALQFSRGARRGPAHAGSTGAQRRARRRRSADAEASRCDSLKTEERTTIGRRRRSGGRILRPSSDLDDRPASASTGSASTGSTECRPSSEDGLLRKEVIQPHLPVRLPCYDFTPITDPTFDGSLPNGLGHWLRVLPTFVV